MIDSRQLRHLSTIAREGSFSRAAEALALSQPALSNSIARLEDQLKVQLFERGRHGAVLTTFGEMLLVQAEQVERILLTAEREMTLGSQNIKGPITVGGTALPLQSLVPATIAKMVSEGRRVAIEVVEAIDADLMEGLTRYQFDLVVSTIDIAAPVDGVIDIPLFTAGIWAVARSDHPLVLRDRITLREIRDCQLALPQPVGTYGVQLKAAYLIGGETIPPATIYTSAFATLREIILQGNCVTLVPKQIVQPDIERGLLKAVPLVESVGRRTFGLRRIAGRNLSAAGERFCQILLDLAPSFASD
jgi:molybdate transport repressor ModE-like protein